MRLTLAISLAVSTGFALPVFADKAEECQLQADIVNRAVELRLERKRQAKVLEIMTSGEEEAVSEKYLGAVPYIVDWVYTLKRKELGPEVGPAYFETCNSQ